VVFLSALALLAIVFLCVTAFFAVKALVLGRRAIISAKPKVSGPGLMPASDVISVVLMGLGVITLMLIPALYWFIHGDHGRYMWVIRGPQPFSQFGGGPYQLWLGVCLLFIGSGMIVSALALRKWFWSALGR